MIEGSYWTSSLQRSRSARTSRFGEGRISTIDKGLLQFCYADCSRPICVDSSEVGPQLRVGACRNLWTSLLLIIASCSTIRRGRCIVSSMARRSSILTVRHRLEGAVVVVEWKGGICNMHRSLTHWNPYSARAMRPGRPTRMSVLGLFLAFWSIGGAGRL